MDRMLVGGKEARKRLDWFVAHEPEVRAHCGCGGVAGLRDVANRQKERGIVRGIDYWRKIKRLE